MTRKLLFLLLVLLTAVVHAETIIERDGQRYSCEPIRSTPPANPATCAAMAYSGPFSRQESQDLCQGVRSNAPAKCALEVYSGPFSKDETMRLCTQVRSIGPGKCAILLYKGPFSKDETMQLCANRFATQQTAQCALEAYSGPFSKEESLEMCKVTRGRHNKKSKNTFKIPMTKKMKEILIIKANKKSAHLNEYKM